MKVTPVQIAALTSAFLSEEDPLLLEARLTTSSWTGRQAALYVEVLARQLEDEKPTTLQDITGSSFVSRVYESSQDLWFYKGVVLPAGLMSPDVGSLPHRGDPFDHIDQDLDALQDDVIESDGYYTLFKLSDAVLALSYELKARHHLAGVDLREGLLELLSGVDSLRAQDVVDTLVDSFWHRDLSEEEQVDLLARVLQLNFPHIAEIAEVYDVADFDAHDFSNWRALSMQMMRYWDDEWED